MHIWVIPILLEKDAFKKNILLSLYSKLSDNTYNYYTKQTAFYELYTLMNTSSDALTVS